MSQTQFIETLRRSHRNWKRNRNRVLPAEASPPFFYAKDIDAVWACFSGLADEQKHSLSEFANGIHGRCFICDENVLFSIDTPADGGPVNWRETLVCPHCKLINRWRSCLHGFETICAPGIDDRIYLTEALSPIYRKLAGRFPSLISSEYFPDETFGEVVQTHTIPVRNEDVTSLSLSDSSMDIVLSFDVLEHVPDYRMALREFHRVLDTGGQLVLSVPFSDKQETLVRATMDDEGRVTHLVEPCYHGDPLSDQGVLSFYDFGMELLDELHEAGFQECFLLCCHSKKWAYLGGDVVFIARKLKASDSKESLFGLALRSAGNQARLLAEKSTEISRYSFLTLKRNMGRLFSRLSPGRSRKRQLQESGANVNQTVLELPDIFHYWSNKYLLPDMSRFGFENPDDFFFQNTKAFMKDSKRRRIKVLSVGCGDCDFEIKITKRLLRWQLSNFVIECIDVNKEFLETGKRAVEAAGLDEYFLFTQCDLNHWKPYRYYEIVFSNQSLHDVRNLEGLFDSIKRALRPGGLFMVSDTIGRNAERCWPETLDALKPFWSELPMTYRYNRVWNRQETQLIGPDAPGQVIETGRSQDILSLLEERFSFKFFFPYGNIVFMFIDRAFGHNFDASAAWDRDFVDRAHARDEEGLIRGEFTPCSMMAVLTNRETETVLRHPALTPVHCLPNMPIEAAFESQRIDQ